MSDLGIKQQDAKELAAGYSKTFRVVEILSILSFWSLSIAIAVKASAFAATYPWVIVAALACGFIMADFVGGFVHWMADTWGSTNMPVLGKALIRPFREHHVDPKAMTRHDYIETNGANCMISVPVAAMTLAIPLDIEGWVGPALFTVVSMGSMIFWVMMTNQIHKWSHLDADQTPTLLRWAQRLHLVLPPTHHDRHHTAPFDTYYCITTGWLNWPLHKIGFFRILERMVMAVSGAIPRKDDIGLVAALKVAPVDPKPSTPHAAS
jgi:ubiquitin-conjugating enzyme E2 variant